MPQRAEAMERFATTIVASDRLEDVLPDLTRQLGEAVQADVVVVRLRDGDRLKTRAAIGFRGDPEADYEHAVDLLADRFSESGPHALDPGRSEDAIMGAALARQEIATIFALPMRQGDACEGVAIFGWRSIVDLNEEQRSLLKALGSLAAPAFVRFRAIAERDRAIKAAERALALRDEVLGVVAHDLRNPLNVITTACDLLDGQLTEPAQRRHLDRVRRSVQRADRLVRDLLEVNAYEGSGLTIEKRRVEVVEVVLSAIESQQVLAADASVVLNTDLSPSLPAILVDELRIQEVLENLISNAIKFNVPGGQVTIGAGTYNGTLRLWVKDSGTGIPAEHLPHVFDRFWQGVKRDKRGAGLGLAICRAIIDSHGGKIWAESDPGVGTTMSFTLPLAPPGVARVEASTRANLLLVDDRPENLIALGAILSDPRYRLVTATSGEEALREALRDDFVVALIDVAMPGMDGLEVARHLKKLARYRDIPILFVTAFGDDPEEIHRAYAAGGADYIVKPLDAEIVRKKVAVFVELAQRHRSPDLVVS
ncbi:MAG TPA: hybrid sensor histidine kinase/response regulator [Kofleriaceae bacterium]|nr:hybrid sensor histidine kinase/response regulator [Kofleriaceae bacterium]